MQKVLRNRSAQREVWNERILQASLTRMGTQQMRRLNSKIKVEEARERKEKLSKLKNGLLKMHTGQLDEQQD